MNTCPLTNVEIPDFSGDGKTHWFALHVRSNFERTVSKILQNKGYEEFLPTYRSPRRWSKEEESPLFPGYLFCRLDQHNRFPVLSTRGVVRIVGMGKTPLPVAAREVEAIWRIAHSDLVVDPWPYLEAGEAVTIEGGPLKGLKGVLVECRKARRLVVSVALLQRSVAVEIDEEHVRPVGGVHRAIVRSLSSLSGGGVPRKAPQCAYVGSVAANGCL